MAAPPVCVHVRVQGWARGHLLEACRAGLESLQLYLALTQQTLALGARGAGAAHAHLAGALGRAHALLLRRAALVLPTTTAPAQAHAGAQEEGEGADDLKAHSSGAGAARPPPSLRAGVVVLSAALGLTSLASLAGLVFYVGRCRQLTTQLQQRDRVRFGSSVCAARPWTRAPWVVAHHAWPCCRCVWRAGAGAPGGQDPKPAGRAAPSGARRRRAHARAAADHAAVRTRVRRSRLLRADVC